jgi:N-acetylglucosamine-6-phosphate deacetylase
MTRHAIAASRVFDGARMHQDCAVVIEGARIAAVVPTRDLPAGLGVRKLAGGSWLVPGFIDVQVNGGGDVLFNDAPTAEGIAAIAAAHRRFGTTALLPTLISDTAERMRAAIEAVESTAHPGILGIHLEGPFLSPEKSGAHDRRMLRAPDRADEELLKTARRHLTVVTLAPEQVPPGFIAGLAAAGVRVSLGHSMATYDETRAALSEGLSGFTHLFNAMRPLGSREPGPIAVALEEPVYFGLIVDGVHVAPPTLRLALRGAGRPMLVTDAMPPVGGRSGKFALAGHEITARDGRLTRADGTLAGSLLDMASAVRNCVRLLDVPLTSALAFASANPASFLGVESWLGRIAPGFRADMVALDPEEIRVLHAWVAGAPDNLS